MTKSCKDHQKSKMTKMTLTKMTRLGLLVKYNNISC